jgi:hypothetical protein
MRTALKCRFHLSSFCGRLLLSIVKNKIPMNSNENECGWMSTGFAAIRCKDRNFVKKVANQVRELLT